jgi:glycosyltransferase involved in cell wall biosynthesis
MGANEALDRPRVLHVEVGGTYGGSLRALEVYLKYADNSRLSHDLLVYFPTPRLETVAGLVDRCWTLRERVPSWLARPRLKARGGRAEAAAFGKLSLTVELKELATNVRRRLPLLPSVIRMMTRGRYQVVHVNNTFTYQPEAILAARLLRIPVVAHLRNPVRRSRLAQYLLSLTHKVVAVSRAPAELLRFWGDYTPVVVTYDGTEMPTVDPVRVSLLRQRWLPSGGLLAGSVGRLDHQKGYPILLRAARCVLDSWQRSVPVRFAIAGEGPQRRELEGLIRDLGLEAHVALCGFVPDAANFIASLDVLVSSSLWEGGPLAAVEAALLEVPIVATAVGVVPEVLSDYRVARPVPPGDPAVLAEAILSVLEWRLNTPPDQREEELKKLKVAAARLHDPRQSAQHLDEILSSAVAQARSQGAVAGRG